MRAKPKTIAVLVLIALVMSSATIRAAESDRASEGLVVYYPFTEGSGSTLSDQSNNGSALNLELSGAVAWLADSTGVDFTGGRIGTSTSADKIINALIASGASTFEVWAHPANLTQDGPARLISVGIDRSHQNFVLGQDESDYQLQLRHTAKSPSGRPYLEASDGVARRCSTSCTPMTELSNGCTLTVSNGRRRWRHQATIPSGTQRICSASAMKPTRNYPFTARFIWWEIMGTPMILCFSIRVKFDI